MPHISHDDLNIIISLASKQVLVGSIYKHYKYPERDYLVEKICIQEATEKPCVVYRDIKEKNAPSFVRDLDSWLEYVVWNGKRVPRFTLQGPTL